MKFLITSLMLAFGLGSYAQHIIVNPNRSSIKEGVFVNSKGEKFNGFTQAFRHEHLKKEEFTYNHGKKHGPSATYYSNGMVREYGQYVNNERQGEWKMWDQKGNLTMTLSYEKGRKNGIAYTYYRNKNKKCEMYYDNDQKTGKWHWWNSKGELIKSEIF